MKILNPRRVLMAAAIVAACHFAFAFCQAADPASPNVLIMLCDDLGYGDLGCYGHPMIKTPNLDQLASEGIRLTDCYSSAPICSSSRAGLLTGRTPTRCGIYSWIAENNPMNLLSDETTIATLLKNAGYQTCHSGKWHLNGYFNDPRHTQPNDHGFDHWFSTHNNARPSHAFPTNFVRNGKPVGKQDGYSCQVVADEAINWLKNVRDPDKPFFVHVCFHETHEPVASPEELVAEYPQARNADEAQYFANATNMDRAVGKLMKALDELNLAEDTLVFFTSDNGPETLSRYRSAKRSYGSPGPLRGMKLHMYDGGIRVPGILRWNGTIQPGQVVNTPISSVDLLPTVCELAEIPLPTDKVLDGTSIVPLLHGRPSEIQREKPLFWHYYGGTNNRQFAMRDGDWKLVAWWDQADDLHTGATLRPGDVPMMKRSHLVGFELYNIANDIGEKDNLASAEPERLKRMSEQAHKIYEEIIAEGPYWFDEDRPDSK